MTSKMESPIFRAPAGGSGWRAPVAGLIIGISLTVLMFAVLGWSALPATDDATDGQETLADDPFLPQATEPGGDAQIGETEACAVMETAINDINARMSEGVTEAQAKYFRARRNKIYLLMRERCGL